MEAKAGAEGPGSGSEQDQEKKSLGKRLGDPVPGSRWSLIFFALALVVLLTDLDPDRAWPVAALLLVGLLVAVVPGRVWKELLGNVESFNAGPVGIKMRQNAKEAAAQAPDSDNEEGPGAKRLEKADTMFTLRTRLEYKLTYVAKHLLAPSDENATFLTIGSLKLDGYLTEAEAKTALDILSIREEELEKLSEAEQEVFLENANRFVDGVRASIFWGQAKRRITGKDKEYGTEDLLLTTIANSSRRDDFLVHADDGLIRVATAFALDRESKLLEGVKNRLEREDTDGKTVARAIVIPDRSRVRPSDVKDWSVAVVKLAALRVYAKAA